MANTDGGQYCPQAVPNNRWSYYDGTEMIGDDITIECHGASAKKGKKVWQQSENFKTISCPGSMYLLTYALSFYMSQNVLGWSKCFVPDQKSIYILCQSQTFCARQKDDLHSVKLVFVMAQKFLKKH